MQKILNRVKTSYLLLINVLIIFILLLFSEVLFDFSILSSLYFFLFGFIISIMIPFLCILGKVKNSEIIFTICLTFLFITIGICYLLRTTYDILLITYDDVIDIKNNNLDSKIFKYIPDTSVKVCIYGKSMLNYDLSDLNNITFKDIYSKINAFIETIQKTQSSNIFELDCTKLGILNSGDYELFCKALNSVYFTKLKKNIILLLKIDNFEALKSSGFKRSVKNIEDLKKPKNNFY